MAEEQKITNGFETPVNILWDNVLLIPVFGTMDSTRAQAIMETILQKIVETGSKAIILDILGVDTVDSGVANHMISRSPRLANSLAVRQLSPAYPRK